MEEQQQQVQTRSLLHINALIGNIENVQKLIAEGQDVNQIDLNGCTPISLASASGHLELVKLLLLNGAKPDSTDPLHGNCSLHEASWRGFSCLVKTLCNPDTINKQNKGGFTPLHLSTQAGHNQSTRELLVANADPNLVNTYGDTPLHTSVRYGHAGVARILLSARAATDIQNKNGDCPLHISAAMGRKKLTKILLQSGCRQDLKNHQRETPLNISLRKGFDEVSTILQNPPQILTPMQRDELRASKYKVGQQQPKLELKSTKWRNPHEERLQTLHRESRKFLEGHLRKSKSGPDLGPVSGRRRERELMQSLEAKASSSKATIGTSNSGPQDLIMARSSGRRSLVFGKGAPLQLRSSQSQPMLQLIQDQKGNLKKSGTEEPVKWSPYGCHYFPSPSAFPPPNLDSLPKEPLTSGELYYLDLAGNIHKGPMGISEGCYCSPLLHPGPEEGKEPGDLKESPEEQAQCVKSCQDQLKTLTSQLSKIHLDTQAQLSSLHSLLNERLKESGDRGEQTPAAGANNQPPSHNEQRLREWVKAYRRFRKELSKNPKALHIQANELLESANNLILTRPPSPPVVEDCSDSDSGL